MAKQTGGVAAKVEQMVRPSMEELGLRLWDVRFEKEGPDWFLRVLIDRDIPLDTDTCELASRRIDPLLDEADLIDQSYYLEVGSPGLGRKLTRPEHFEALQGQVIEGLLIRPAADDTRLVRGTLLEYKDGVVLLGTQEGEVPVEEKETSYFKLCDDDNLFGKD